MNLWNTAKAKVISISTILAGIAVISTFFNVEIPTNAYMSDVEASEERQQRELSLTRADVLTIQARIYRKDLRGLNREIADNAIVIAQLIKTQQAVPPKLIVMGADLKSEWLEVKAELEEIKEQLRNLKFK